MPKKLDLNCDLGEKNDTWFFGKDRLLLDYITSINISCGFHAGDPILIKETLCLAKEKGLRIGAHPGFEDKANFGRKAWPLSPKSLVDLLERQLKPFLLWAAELGVEVHHIKAHGALYNLLAKDSALSEAYCSYIRTEFPNWKVYGLPNSQTAYWAGKKGLPFWSEAFADRSYQSNGQLSPRSNKDAFISCPEAAVKQVRRIVDEGKLLSLQGIDIPLSVDTICLHGDGPHALPMAIGLKNSGLFE